MIATYTESLFGRNVRLTAEVWISGRAMHFVVREPQGDVPVFFSLQMPGPPASVICGMMSGVAFVSNDPLPCACRIVFIRVPDGPRLDGTNRYFESVPGAIAADMVGLGLDVPEGDCLDAFTRAFLGTSPNRVTPQDQATFASMLDSVHLNVAYPV